MKKSLLAGSVLAWSSMTACGGGAGIATAVDFDPSADFDSYMTYVWVEDLEEVGDAQTDGFIRDAVDAQLAAKGLRPVESGEPDVGVGYRVAINNSTTQEMIGRGWSGGYRSTSGYSGGGTGAMQRDVEHVAGTLFIMLFDGQSKEAAWTGVGNGTINPDLGAEDRRERIASAVAEIMKEFPPG